VWATEVMPALKSFPRAIFAATKLVGVRDGMVAIAAPNEPHRQKCQQHLPDVEAALQKVIGEPVKLVLSVDSRVDDGSDDKSGDGTPDISNAGDATTRGNVVQMKRPAAPPADEEIDLNDLVDAPLEAVLSPEQRLAQAFPGSQIIDE